MKEESMKKLRIAFLVLLVQGFGSLLGAQEAQVFDLFDSYESLLNETADMETWEIQADNPSWVDQRFWAQGADPSYLTAPAVLYCQVLGQEPRPIGVLQLEEGVLYVYYDFVEDLTLVEKSTHIAAPFSIYRGAQIPLDETIRYDDLYNIYWKVLEGDANPYEDPSLLEELIQEINSLAEDLETKNRDSLYDFYYYLVYGDLFDFEGFGAIGELVEQYKGGGRYPGVGPNGAIVYGFIRSSMSLEYYQFAAEALGWMINHFPDFVPTQAMLYHFLAEGENKDLLKAKLLENSQHWAVKELGLD
jgi:hypothetical protein